MHLAEQLKSLEGYRLYTAMYEFTARSDDELSLNPGDMVWVCALDIMLICSLQIKRHALMHCTCTDALYATLSIVLYMYF